MTQPNINFKRPSTNIKQLCSQYQIPPNTIKPNQISAEMASLGIGAASFVCMNALNFVQNNYDSLINNGIKIHDNWNELEIAWHLIETVGFENTFSLVCGTLSFTIEHGDWILEAANLLEMTGVGVDIADAASTLGLSLLLSGAVWGITKLANGSQEEQLKQLIEENKKIQEIHFMLKKEFPSNEIATRLTNINPILLGR